MEWLAEEIVLNMLSRLPAKDLIRCKCVCKSWFDLITDPQFISNYYVFYNNQQEHLLLIRKPNYCSKETEISIVSWNSNEPKGHVSSRVINPPLFQDQMCGDIMGPCNGIYFFKGKPNIIMNPSLGHFIALPQPLFPAITWAYSSLDFPRFGFDPKTNDYKVVLITDLWLDFEVMGEWTVEVYSLNSNSWKILEHNAIPFPFETSNTSRFYTYVNDCCHWWGCVHKPDKDESDDVENVVLSFDMVSELFRKIKVPKITHSSSSSSSMTVKSNKNLIPFSESATIGVLDYYHVDQGMGECFCFDVWMMIDYWDEGSWIKRYSVGPMPVIFNQLVGYYGSNQSLWKDTNHKLVLYGLDCEEHTRDLLVCGNHEYESIGAVRYMESLVILQRGIRF